MPIFIREQSMFKIYMIKVINDQLMMRFHCIQIVYYYFRNHIIGNFFIIVVYAMKEIHMDFIYKDCIYI